MVIVGGKQEILFSPSDFLEEAINDFLESGAKSSRIASAVIKVATGVELLMKERLERICPALILDKLDEAGLQVATVFGLGSRMRFPRELETVELKTAVFPVLLARASTFFDISAAAPHLLKLHKIRNSLIHHRGKVVILDVNLLLVKHVFPFIEKISNEDKVVGLRITNDTWAKIHELEKLSVDELGSQLAKKIAHHAKLASELSSSRKSLLAESTPETVTRDEQIVEDKLVCPACKNEALTAFQDFDVDTDEYGHIAGGYRIFGLRCRLCGLLLDEDEAQYIIGNFKEYLGADKDSEKMYWVQAIEPDHPEDW